MVAKALENKEHSASLKIFPETHKKLTAIQYEISLQRDGAKPPFAELVKEAVDSRWPTDQPIVAPPEEPIPPSILRALERYFHHPKTIWDKLQGEALLLILNECYEDENFFKIGIANHGNLTL